MGMGLLTLSLVLSLVLGVGVLPEVPPRVAVSMVTVLLIAVGYGLGSIPTGLLIARWQKGVDIRQHGSGNIGMTNVLRAVGKGPAVLTLVGDLAKGVDPCSLGTGLVNLPLGYRPRRAGRCGWPFVPTIRRFPRRQRRGHHPRRIHPPAAWSSAHRLRGVGRLCGLPTPGLSRLPGRCSILADGGAAVGVSRRVMCSMR